MKKLVRLMGIVLALALAVCVTGCGEDTPTPSPAPTPAFTVPESLTLREGFTARIEPADVENVESFSYLSLDEAVATVDDAGLVTGVAPGTATVKVAGGSLTKDVSVTVTENLVNGLSVKKLDAVAAFTEQQSTVLDPASSVWNFGWDADITPERLAQKFDFTGASLDSDVILRGMSSVEKYSAVENGGYCIAMIAGANPGLTEQSLPEGAHVTVYGKTKVSALAEHFRLWGCSWKNDVVGGMGSVRVVAYVADPENRTYTAVPLTAIDKGELPQDEEGWIDFEDTSMPTCNIVGAPADNMFLFSVKCESYDLTGKEVVLAVEFRAKANGSGADGTNLQCRFGIKRMGFMLAEPAA